MTRREMRSVLRRWGRSKKRLEGLRAQIEAIYEEIETVEGMQTVNMDGMPHGGAGKPTEARAIRALSLRERYEDRLARLRHDEEEIEILNLRIEGAIILRLTRRQEQVIRELYQNGGTHETVAERLGITPRALRITEATAIEKLIEELERW